MGRRWTDEMIGSVSTLSGLAKDEMAGVFNSAGLAKEFTPALRTPRYRRCPCGTSPRWVVLTPFF